MPLARAPRALTLAGSLPLDGDLEPPHTLPLEPHRRSRERLTLLHVFQPAHLMIGGGSGCLVSS